MGVYNKQFKTDQQFAFMMPITRSKIDISTALRRDNSKILATYLRIRKLHPNELRGFVNIPVICETLAFDKVNCSKLLINLGADLTFDDNLPLFQAVNVEDRELQDILIKAFGGIEATLSIYEEALTKGEVEELTGAFYRRLRYESLAAKMGTKEATTKRQKI